MPVSPTDSGADIAEADAVTEAGADVPPQPDGDESDAGCSALSAADAPEVTTAQGSGAPPTPMGGPVADGTYYSTAQRVYGPSGAPPVTARSALRVSGNRYESAQVHDGETSVHSGTVSTSDTTLQIAVTCPSVADPRSYGYTATPTQLTIIATGSGITLVTVYQRQ